MPTFPNLKPRQSMLMGIPEGDPGTYATLRLMRDCVRRYKKNPEIRRRALQITSRLRGKDYPGEARAVQEFVRRAVRYVRDIRNVETLQTPDTTLRVGQGDCDDQAVLAASLLEAVGHPTRFVAVAFDPAVPYQHVFTETKIGNKWVPLETTENFGFGFFPYDRVRKRMAIHN